MIRKIIISLGIGVFLAVFSIFIAIFTFSSDDSIFLRVILWNFFAAGFLAEKGWLGMCSDCELITVFYIFADSFIVGFIGYSILGFCSLLLAEKLRDKKEL